MVAFTWLVCLLLLVLNRASTAEDDHLHDDERVYCSGGVIPGIERMSRGIDITELDLTPSNLHSANGYRASVIDFTCKEGRVWVNPTADATKYKRPDQIAGVNTLPAGQLKAITEISGDAEDYRRTRSGKVGLDMNFLKFAFSASGGLKDVQENMYRSNRSVAETSAMASAIQVDFKSLPHLKLTYEFTEFIPTNPVPAYDESPDLYDNFIRTFGTHYFAKAIFGGFIFQKTAINEGYMLNNDEREITANLEASFFSKVKTTAEGADTRKNVSDSFARNTQTEIYYFGGTPVTIDQANPTGWMDEWLKTVNKDPWLFSGELKPIEELIANQQVKNEVKKALRVKMARAYLEELKYIVQIGQFNLSAKDQLTFQEAEKKLNSRDGKDIQELLKQLEDIFETVQEIRDRALLLQLTETWNAKIPDILTCKWHISQLCTPSMSTPSWVVRRNAEVFIFEVNAIATSKYAVEHKKAKQFLSDARSLITYYQKPDTVCDPWQLPKEYDNCESCTAHSASLSYHASYKPACRTKEAWKVIGFKPK